MHPGRTGISYDFGSRLTWLGKRLLLLYGGVYILELILEHWIGFSLYSYLCIYPFQNGNFHIWQIITHPFLHDPRSPFAFIIACVVFYFFAGPVEGAFGQKRFLILNALSRLLTTIIRLRGLRTPVSMKK